MRAHVQAGSGKFGALESGSSRGQHLSCRKLVCQLAAHRATQVHTEVMTGVEHVCIAGTAADSLLHASCSSLCRLYRQSMQQDEHLRDELRHQV